MAHRKFRLSSILILLFCLTATALFADPPEPPQFTWATVVDNNDDIPDHAKKFNSYNQPSVNDQGLVVFRARGKGGGGGTIQGIYTRDMAAPDGDIVRIFERDATRVPCPNNLGTPFGEPPSFPRIDRSGETIVTRANHKPVWSYTPADPTETTRAGTSGIYANPYGELITAASKLGGVSDYAFFAVPGSAPPTFFDVFPGAPAVTHDSDDVIIAFKGNFTLDGKAETGAYYRRLADLSCTSLGDGQPVKLLADTFTPIPGTNQTFGSVSPPSAEGSQVVFAAFDDEQHPGLGGIYQAWLDSDQPLLPLVEIGSQVPGEPPNAKFVQFGEGLSFDGHNVGFWGAWGKRTRTMRLYCPEEGNKDRIAYCNQAEPFAGANGDPNTTCDDTGCYQEVTVPVYQGIFVHNIDSGQTFPIAKTGEDFFNFLFWNYSGRVPGTGEGSGEEEDEGDGEAIRWRSSAFVAVSGMGDSPSATAFQAVKYDDRREVVGIYAWWQGLIKPVTVLDTTMAGQDVDSNAPSDSTITELGLERDGFRGNHLVISARMGIEGEGEDEGMAGIYMATVPPNQQ